MPYFNHRKQEMLCEWAHSIIASGLLYRKKYPDAKPSGPVRSESLLLFENVKQERIHLFNLWRHWNFYFTLLIFCKVRAHSFLVFKSSNSRKVWKFQTQTVFASLRKERNKNTIYKGNWSQDINDVSKYMQCIWSKIYV